MPVQEGTGMVLAVTPDDALSELWSTDRAVPGPEFDIIRRTEAAPLLERLGEKSDDVVLMVVDGDSTDGADDFILAVRELGYQGTILGVTDYQYRRRELRADKR